MKIIDAHSHIDYITHQQQTDVVGTVCCTTGETQWQQLVDLIKYDKNIYGAFGVHPWFVENVSDDFIVKLENILKSDSNYMIGEIGLDKYKQNIEKQLKIFVKQFDLAVKLKRTMFVHCVGAWDRILHVLKQYKKSELPILVIHGFNANQKIMEQLLQYENILFSFNKIDINHRNSRIESIPDNKILVETDGKKDVILKTIVNQIMDVKQEPDIWKTIFDNMQRVLTNGQIK